jgi:hypothetical protein
MPDVSLATISGTVWLHAATGVTPYANGTLFGWVDELNGSGHTTGAIRLDANGKYKIFSSSGARVRIYAGSGFGDHAVYQPCEVTAKMVGDGTRDVRVVTDVSQLGAQLPPPMLDERPTLSGTVFDVDQDGRHVPLKDVRVELDGLHGLGLVTATTLTDADGRYTLCGLGGETSTVLYASRTGYQLFEATVPLSGDTTLNIHLQHLQR